MRTRFKMTKLSTAFAAVAMLGTVAGFAHADVWDDGGADSEFSTVENWEFDVFPTRDVLISLVSNGLGSIDGAFTVERSVNSNIERSEYFNGAVLNITGGDHSDSRAGNTIRTFVGTTGDGTVNMSGGSWNIGHILFIGNNDGNTGIFNVTGGDLAVSRGGNSFMGIDGGSSIEIGTNGGTGLLSLSGSSSLLTRIGVGVGSTGVFEVIGSGHGPNGIGIGASGSLDGSWTQEGDLRVGLDAGGLTPINVVVTTSTGLGAGNVTFVAGSILDPFDAGDANNAWTTVMSWDGTLADGGLALSSAANSAGWEMRFEGNALQVRNLNFDDPVAGIAGDFDGNMIVDCADLDGYVGNIGATVAANPLLAPLDIDGNGTISADDANTHITTLVTTDNGVMGTFPGDLNCDGMVTVLGDAFILVGSLGTPAETYAEGDINFDGTVNVLGDAFILVGQLGNSNAQ